MVATAERLLSNRRCVTRSVMDLDALLLTFFGTTELDDLEPAEIAGGQERIAVAFGMEQDPGRRFALWVILHGLGEAPNPAVAFKDRAARDAAEAYLRAMARHG